MKSLFVTIVFYGLSLSYSLGQSSEYVDSLLSDIGTIKDSKEIRNTYATKILKEHGLAILPVLVNFFQDSTKLKTYSECLDRKLSKGDIAIIIADVVEPMPYYTVTGVQNCLFSFCPDNPNLIEYYLRFSDQNELDKFEQNYSKWLQSEEREEWSKMFFPKEKRR